MTTALEPTVRRVLQRGVVIPAHPLALTAQRKLDERRQRALSRYYIAAGAGGLAVGVHTTQFAIRRPELGLFQPVLELAAEEMDRADRSRGEPLVRMAGICGATAAAVAEAETARGLGYHAGLLSTGALAGASDAALIEHCRAVAATIPLFGFYLQPAVGGRLLPYASGGDLRRSRTSWRSRSRRSTAIRRSTWSAPWPSRAATTSPCTPATTTTSCWTC